jgi:hypothetical protein
MFLPSACRADICDDKELMLFVPRGRKQGNMKEGKAT